MYFKIERIIIATLILFFIIIVTQAFIRDAIRDSKEFEEVDTIVWQGTTYPKEVPYKQGMTLLPNQSTIFSIEMPMESIEDKQVNARTQ